MDEEQRPPRTILKIPLRPLVIIIVVLAGLFIVAGPLDLEDFRDSLISPKPDDKSASKDTSSGEQKEIVATQEMIKKAAEEVQAEKFKALESTETIRPTDRFFYIIELVNGDDLESTNITIKPETVIITSAGGTVTTIPRSSVKNISRFRLKETTPAPP